MKSFLIYIGVKSNVFQLLYGSYPPILLIDCKDFTHVFPKALLGTNTKLNNKTTSKQRLDELFITKQDQKLRKK